MSFTKELFIKKIAIASGLRPRDGRYAVAEKIFVQIIEPLLKKEPVAINDDMAYAFHHALSDSALGVDEVEVIKTGLRAAFANVTAPTAQAADPKPLAWLAKDVRTGDYSLFRLIDAVNIALSENQYLEITPLYAAPPAPVTGTAPTFHTDAARFLPECLKPEEISGDARNSRIAELMGWFDRYYSGKANPKWFTEHTAELCYYILTATPAPVVPEEIEPDHNNTYDYVDGWNASRAEILKNSASVKPSTDAGCVTNTPSNCASVKDHQIRELVNDLRDIAVEYHGTQQLRERIARTVRAPMLNHSENERDMVEPVSQHYKLPPNSFTDAELEMMAHGDNPQANAYRELLSFRRGTRQ